MVNVSSSGNGPFSTERGRPYPLGASADEHGVNFAVFSSQARGILLSLHEFCDQPAIQTIPFDPLLNRTGNVWHIYVRGARPGIKYGYRLECDASRQQAACDPDIILLDPYARLSCGGWRWNDPYKIKRDNKWHTFRLAQVIRDDYDWEGDQPLAIPMEDSVIYETHLRGFTRHESSGVQHPGTFRGLMEKIPYLQSLGITAVELLPVTDFDETEFNSINPQTHQPQINYWGYSPISFFAIKAAYASDTRDLSPLHEFRDMVKALHRAGIEVILDIVFNHTAEGNYEGEFYNFKMLDNRVYYITEVSSGRYLDFSGCGNTLNCNHPVVKDMILESLRYWVTEMHVDGFRFDLASILGRGRDGSVLLNPPILERIAEDPILAGTKLIAEAWDAAGLYQVGNFPHWYRWMEWNGRYRDDVRRFIRGDEGMAPALAMRLTGSSDLYQDDGRAPYHSVNFITCHDGFTLTDLVSYNYKHNENNGENNRDGSDYNLSWNCGVEGESRDAQILELRSRQRKNFLTILMMAQGVPMMLGGDEFGRTQKGNNNTYCQDNELSWFNWAEAEQNASLVRFVRELIRLRKNMPMLHRTSFVTHEVQGLPEMVWLDEHGIAPNWEKMKNLIGLFYPALPNHSSEDLLIIVNSERNGYKFQLPRPGGGKSWHMTVDTAADAPADIYEAGQEKYLQNQTLIEIPAHSTLVLLSR